MGILPLNTTAHLHRAEVLTCFKRPILVVPVIRQFVHEVEQLAILLLHNATTVIQELWLR